MRPKNKLIPLSEPFIRGNEWKYVKECLETGWVSSAGGYVSRLEEMVAGYVGAKYAVAMANGTAALHLSLLACGVEPRDEVIAPTLTFIASVNVISYCQAYPVFMDCNAKTLCIDVDKVAGFLKNECARAQDGFTYNKKTKRRIKAIIPVHIFGHPADMDTLLYLCEKYNISLIEDAAESIGSEYKNKKTGSLGQIGCFSFNGNKIITAGGGGMAVTDNELLAGRLRHLSTQAKDDPFEYSHNEIGYNYRLTNLAAALGVAQMERLDEFIATKRKNALLYVDLLSGMSSIDFLQEEPYARCNYWFYTIKVPPEDKKPLIEYLLSKNVQVRPIWKLIHTLDMYKDCETHAIDNALKAYESCLNLPCSVSLKGDDLRFVAESIQNFFNMANEKKKVRA